MSVDPHLALGLKIVGLAVRICGGGEGNKVMWKKRQTSIYLDRLEMYLFLITSNFTSAVDL